MIALVVGMILVTPVLACPAGAPCSMQKIPHTEITGVERNANIALALNMKDAKTLLGSNLSTTDLKQIEDAAKVYSLEKNMTNGSKESAKAVILPVETVNKTENSTQITNVIAVWNQKFDSPKVMSTTYIFKNKKVYGLVISRVGENGEILSSTVVNNGSYVKGFENSTTGFNTQSKISPSLSPYWSCVVNSIVGDCWCNVLGQLCPPNTPGLCDICVTLLTPCVNIPSVVTCGPAAACMGLEIAVVMYNCY